MMSFKLVRPQRAVHEDGYEVSVADRFHVDYKDPTLSAQVEVDFGELVIVFRSTLRVKYESAASASQGAFPDVVGRIAEGLRAMGTEVEIVEPVERFR
jgi:hypothetical protein